jgi:hypothetical protein
MYGSQVWGFHDATAVERVHLQYCKHILKLRKSTCNYFVYGELGRTPLLIERKCKIIKYWLSIVMHKQSTLMGRVYLNSVDLGTGWTALVQNLLETLGFAEVWLNQGVENINIFMKICKLRLRDQFTQEWQSSINNSPESILYRHLKRELCVSDYFTKINVHKYRVAFCQFICRNHRLAVITGKWHKPTSIPYTERVCLTCEVVEDEFHFILECPKHRHLRTNYIKKYYYSRPNMAKLLELFSCQNTKIIRNLSVYIQKAMLSL